MVFSRICSAFEVTPPRGWVGANAHWVAPELVAEVEFSEWTADGRLRHPSFKGLRRDKPAAVVVREVAAPADPSTVAGIKISHPERVMYPARGLTKLDLARYLEEVSPWMLPQVIGRPLTLVQCPEGLDGGCHYLRHAKVWGPVSCASASSFARSSRADLCVNPVPTLPA